jgi:hypothetical protein
VATWDYVPASVREAVADLKNVLVSGDFGGTRLIHIERLQVNVNHVSDGGVVINIQDSLDKLPPDLQQKVRSLIATVHEQRELPEPSISVEKHPDRDHP